MEKRDSNSLQNKSQVKSNPAIVIHGAKPSTSVWFHEQDPAFLFQIIQLFKFALSLRGHVTSLIAQEAANSESN